MHAPGLRGMLPVNPPNSDDKFALYIEHHLVID